MTKKDLTCGGSHKGAKFAHITKVHPCYNEKLHDKVGRVHVPIGILNPAKLFENQVFLNCTSNFQNTHVLLSSHPVGALVTTKKSKIARNTW